MGTVSANLVAAIEPTELGNQEKVELSLAQGDFAETTEQFSDPAGCVTTCYTKEPIPVPANVSRAYSDRCFGAYPGNVGINVL